MRALGDPEACPACSSGRMRILPKAGAPQFSHHGARISNWHSEGSWGPPMAREAHLMPLLTSFPVSEGPEDSNSPVLNPAQAKGLLRYRGPTPCHLQGLNLFWRLSERGHVEHRSRTGPWSASSVILPCSQPGLSPSKALTEPGPW